MSRDTGVPDKPFEEWTKDDVSRIQGASYLSGLTAGRNQFQDFISNRISERLAAHLVVEGKGPSSRVTVSEQGYRQVLLELLQDADEAKLVRLLAARQ